MKKLLFFALSWLLAASAFGQPENPLAQKVLRLVEADAEFVDVRSSVVRSQTLPEYGVVRMMEGLVTFAGAKATVFAPNQKSVDWIYDVQYEAQELRAIKLTFYELIKALNVELKQKGYDALRQAQFTYIYARPNAPSVVVALEEKGAQGSSVILIMQPLGDRPKIRYTLERGAGGSFQKEVLE
ncbi:MAG: hypothetical protein D6722_05185 [Bacteroidetes bacterium]|nr:MAG: hypothetical protein D6722_05185 [Bacteroidota bacterium]